MRSSLTAVVGAVEFQVREKGASAACRSSAKDRRFESRPLRPASVPEMRAALRRDRVRVIDAFRQSAATRTLVADL